MLPGTFTVIFLSELWLDGRRFARVSVAIACSVSDEELQLNVCQKTQAGVWEGLRCIYSPDCSRPSRSLQDHIQAPSQHEMNRTSEHSAPCRNIQRCCFGKTAARLRGQQDGSEPPAAPMSNQTGPILPDVWASWGSPEPDIWVETRSSFPAATWPVIVAATKASSWPKEALLRWTEPDPAPDGHLWITVQTEHETQNRTEMREMSGGCRCMRDESLKAQNINKHRVTDWTTFFWVQLHRVRTFASCLSISEGPKTLVLIQFLVSISAGSGFWLFRSSSASLGLQPETSSWFWVHVERIGFWL